jgi:hypothetical protein
MAEAQDLDGNSFPGVVQKMVAYDEGANLVMALVHDLKFCALSRRAWCAEEANIAKLRLLSVRYSRRSHHSARQ